MTSTITPQPFTAAPASTLATTLLERFAPVLARIADDAVDRETERRLPFREVGELAASGFTSITVPVEYGGAGADPADLFALLVALAEADANLPQLLRAHFAFVEGLLIDPHRPDRDTWLRRIAAGDIVGNASHERGGAPVGALSTTVVPDGDGWRLDGEKHYSTGALYADWLMVTAQDPSGALRSVTVSATAPGITRRDDWDGFGQRLTGTGSTRFTGVSLRADEVGPFHPNGASTVLSSFLQNVLLATLAGIGRAVVRDAVAFVRGRTRVYSQGSGRTAATDPLVQSVVGRLAADAAAAQASVAAAGHRIARAREAVISGPSTASDLVREAELATVSAQVVVIELVTRATNRLFDVGGASATSLPRALDRHWRNARTLASHNPAIYQERTVGAHLLNGTDPTYFWATGEGT